MKQESEQRIKYPNFGKNFLIALIGIIILSGNALVLNPKTISADVAVSEFGQETYPTNILEEGLLSYRNNTLIPSTAPPVIDASEVRTMRAFLTAYSSCPLQTDDTPFITASGSTVKEGIVANNYLSFGTKIRIPKIFGDQIFVVEDRMHWRKSNDHIDIWFPEYEQAMEFGTKETYIEILKD